MKPVYWITKKLLEVSFGVFYRYRIYGKEHIPQGAAFIAANHASFMDPPLIAAACPEEIAYLAREGLFKVPLLRRVIETLNSYPLKEEGTHNLESFKIIQKLVQENRKVVIFPEGNRTEDGGLQPLKNGLARIAIRTRTIIVPTYLHGTFEAWPRFKRYPKIGPKLACVFGSPINPALFQHLDKKHAQEELTKLIEERLFALKFWYEAGAQGSPP